MVGGEPPLSGTSTGPIVAIPEVGGSITAMSDAQRKRPPRPPRPVGRPLSAAHHARGIASRHRCKRSARCGAASDAMWRGERSQLPPCRRSPSARRLRHGQPRHCFGEPQGSNTAESSRTLLSAECRPSLSLRLQEMQEQLRSVPADDKRHNEEHCGRNQIPEGSL
jgi:hypothetical protein